MNDLNEKLRNCHAKTPANVCYKRLQQRQHNMYPRAAADLVSRQVAPPHNVVWLSRYLTWYRI